VEAIVDVKLNEQEKQQLNESADKVRAMNAALKEVL
jgi:malate/lactate dehydrogenase